MKSPPHAPSRKAAVLRLWPDPYLSPEVPPRDLLWLFRENRAEALAGHPFLDDHLEESPVAALALEALSWTETPAPSPEQEEADLRALMAFWENRRHQFKPAAPAAAPRQARPALQAGLLCEVKDRARTFTAGRWSERYLWQTALHVILTAGPQNELGLQVWRALVASEAELWPEAWREADDLLVRTQDGQQWVAHLWLEHVLAAEQLARPLSLLEPESLELLQSYGADLPDGQPPEDADAETARSPRVHLERQRLLHTCRFLRYTVEAQRAWAAHLQSVIEHSATLEASEVEAAHLAHHLALAAGDRTQIAVLFDSAPVGDVLSRLRRHEKDGGEGCGAVQSAPPTALSNGRCHAVWSLVNAPARLRRNHVFYALHRTTCRVLGGGFLHSNQQSWEAVLCASLWEPFEKVKPEDLLLVVPEFTAA